MRHLIDRNAIYLLPTPPGCPIATAAARVPNLQADDDTKRFASGWGVSPRDAIEGCASEMAERISAQINNDEDFRRSTGEMVGEDIVSPTEITLADDEQAASEDGSPPPWRRDVAIDWVLASPSLSSVLRWLPAGYCFLGHARDRDAGLLPADSNGLAAGRSLEDAAVRAFVELVERDAVAIWWYNRLPRPQLDPADLGDAVVSDYAIWSRDRGRPLCLIDLTHDLGIAVIAAVTHDVYGGSIALGFGAAASAGEAARHAIGELTLFECNVALIERRAAMLGETGGETEMSPEVRRLLQWWRQGRVDANPHLAAGPIRRVDAGLYSSSKLDLADCQRICHQQGLIFLGLDLTRSFIGVPVVRVIVPGLRPMSPRFAPGRLYDVPVRLGWLRQPLRRADLNPVPMVF